jgi:hypothetical protein
MSVFQDNLQEMIVDLLNHIRQLKVDVSKTAWNITIEDAFSTPQ